MSQIRNTLKSNQDDRLADYTDGVMEGQIPQDASTMDPELLLLEETVLRLRRTYPPITLGEARVKQMYIRMKNRASREEQEASQPFWKRWIFPSKNWFLAGAISVVTIFILAVPLLFTPGSSTTSAAALTSTQKPWVVAGLVGVIFFMLWMKRRK